MSDPTGKIKKRSGGGQVKRIAGISGAVKIITGVIQCHNDHNQATQQIDCFNSFGVCS